MSSDQAPSLGVRRRLLFGVPTTLLFAAALEGALAALGIADPTSGCRSRAASRRGRTTSSPTPGAGRAAHADVRGRVARGRGSAARRAAARAAAGRELDAEAHLQARLDAELPEPGFEVIDLGRHGYGSERVRILLEQALELRPDLVLIYLGHSEFVEQGFALELAREWRSDLATATVDRLACLRAMTAAVQLAECLAARDASLLPEAQQSDRAGIFRKLTYDRTQLFYKVYRDNLRAMVELARDAGAGVLLSTVVANDFDRPRSPPSPPASTGTRAPRSRACVSGRWAPSPSASAGA